MLCSSSHSLPVFSERKARLVNESISVFHLFSPLFSNFIKYNVHKLSLRNIMYIILVAVIIGALSLFDFRQHDFLCRFSDGHNKQRRKVLRKAKLCF